ncbi:MAG: DUF4345 family protein [Pseudomonadota bacterium]
MINGLLLKVVLILAGLAIMALGLNIGLGGIQTLGWQVSDPYLTVTNHALFTVQDNHIRFIGGLWFCIGAIFFLGAIFQTTLRATLIILCLAVGFAGLFRLSGADVLNAAILPSLALELIAFPLLALWISRTGKTAPPSTVPV